MANRLQVVHHHHRCHSHPGCCSQFLGILGRCPESWRGIRSIEGAAHRRCLAFRCRFRFRTSVSRLRRLDHERAADVFVFQRLGSCIGSLGSSRHLHHLLHLLDIVASRDLRIAKHSDCSRPSIPGWTLWFIATCQCWWNNLRRLGRQLSRSWNGHFRCCAFPRPFSWTPHRRVPRSHCWMEMGYGLPGHFHWCHLCRLVSVQRGDIRPLLAPQASYDA